MRNKQNSESPDQLIDIVILIKTLWREKMIILFICSLGILIPHIYNNYNSIKLFQTESFMQSSNTDIFSIYEYELNKKQLNEDFANIFIGVLTSNNNFSSFIDQNQNISKGYNLSDFKFDVLQIENLFIKKNNNSEIDNNNLENTQTLKLTLIFKDGVNGQDFLDNFLNYSFERSKEKFKEKLKLSLTNTIEVYERNLYIALAIDLNDPVINPPVYRETQDIFFLGVKVLKQRILNLNYMIKNLDDDIDSISPIYSQASLSSPVPEQPNKYLFYGFILSLFLSLALVFVKNILK